MATEYTVQHASDRPLYVCKGILMIDRSHAVCVCTARQSHQHAAFCLMMYAGHMLRMLLMDGFAQWMDDYAEWHAV